MIYQVSHRTVYHYRQPISISHHALHLTPRDTDQQRCHRTALKVGPTPSVRSSETDYFGNPITFLTVQEAHHDLTLHGLSVVEVGAPANPDPAATMPWDDARRRVAAGRDPDALQAIELSLPSPLTAASPELVTYVGTSFPAGRPILEAALDLTGRINRDFAYDPAATTVSTPVADVFTIRRGVCQDFAHLQLAGLRALGLPARYVSGYLLTHPPEGKDKLVGADASHAWVAIWIPDHGWVDLDPTNDLIPTDEHITLAWGRDYDDVSPITGVIVGGGEHEIDVAVDVTPIEQPVVLR